MSMRVSPRDPYEYIIDGGTVTISAILFVYNWFAGIYQTARTGWYWVMRDSLIGRGYSMGGKIFMTPYVEEDLESLFEEDRLLLIQRKDYSDDTTFPITFMNENIARLRISIPNFNQSPIKDSQIFVSFDVDRCRTTEVQTFIGGVHDQTIQVANRRNIALVYDAVPSLDLFIRPSTHGMYLYGAEIEVLG